MAADYAAVLEVVQSERRRQIWTDAAGRREICTRRSGAGTVCAAIGRLTGPGTIRRLHDTHIASASGIPATSVSLLDHRSSAGQPGMNHLTFTFVTTGPEAGQVRPVVDGEDLLAGYSNDRGLDPDRLLPPLSSILLPTRAARSVLIGSCSCGETGCGSLWLSVHRDGDQVIWEPVPDPRGETLRRSYRFGLVDYLDAVDAAAADRPGEGRGLRVARAVRLMIGLYDGRYESLTYFHTGRIDWVSAWPWDSDTVKASVSDADGQHVLEFDAEPQETDRQFAARIAAELNERRMPHPRSRDT